MQLWLTRAGSSGEYEQQFLDEGQVYLTWEGLNVNLAAIDERDDLLNQLQRVYPEQKLKSLQNHLSQIWAFVHRMQRDDWVVLPSKSQPVVYVGRLSGDYQYHPNYMDPFFHSRSMVWFGQEIPRSHFGQDLLYSFGAFMTICRIQRNNALARLQTMHANHWQAETVAAAIKPAASSPNEPTDDTSEDSYSYNLADMARQQVIRLIEAKFKGHELTRLVAAILQAQGYTVWQSPEGTDGGADILASNGAMGFGEQRICVEVKSGTGTTDRPTVDKLLGAMSKFNADQGLFVAWGGFKQHVPKDMASSFFRLRLWSQDDLLNALFDVYEKLDDELKAQLPLKRVWTVVVAEG